MSEIRRNDRRRQRENEAGRMKSKPSSGRRIRNIFRGSTEMCQCSEVNPYLSLRLRK